MVEVSRLSKKYGQKLAVNNISFKINEGETVGFLGPNGAGKSTTMNMLAGYVYPSWGTVKIGGTDMRKCPVSAKRKIGYLPEHPPLYTEMTVNEQLNFVCDIKRMAKGRNRQLTEICELFGINDVRRSLIKNLSKGYRQRVGLAQAMLGDPQVLILDEPTVGLDPRQIIEIRKAVADYGKNHTVIISSHILSEIAAICDRVLIINNGSIIADDFTRNLSRTFASEKRLIARIEGESGEVQQLIRGLSGVTACEVRQCEDSGSFDYIIVSENNTDIRRDLFDTMAGKSLRILMLMPVEPKLEDIFIRLVKDSRGVNCHNAGI